MTPIITPKQARSKEGPKIGKFTKKEQYKNKKQNWKGKGGAGEAKRGACLLLAANVHVVVLDVPLLEGSGIDLDDGALDEGVGAHVLVRRRIVHDIEETGLAGHGLRGPREVARVKTEGTVLEGTTTDTDAVHLLLTDLGVRGLAAKLEFPLHANADATTTSLAALMDRVTGDTWRGRGSGRRRKNLAK